MSILSRAIIAVKKEQKALEEEVDLLEYLQPHALKAKIENKPFKHVVVDNFFKEEFLDKLVTYFDLKFKEGLSGDQDDKNKFHVFKKEINYDGYVFTPNLTQDEPLKLFYSVTWNLYFAKLFRKPTTFGTNFALHHHPAGDRTGWVHHDYATYTFPHRHVLSNGVTGTQGEDDNGNQKLISPGVGEKKLKQKRTIAILFYLNNPEWKEGDGGETGLYTSKDKSSLVKKIAPINNRLLAFDVSPESYHAFQQNFKERNVFVQWFHADLDWCEKEYGFL